MYFMQYCTIPHPEWVNAIFGPEEIIDLELRVDDWTWKDESTPYAGDYVLCLSMRNSYGDIWIPIGHGNWISQVLTLSFRMTLYMICTDGK